MRIALLFSGRIKGYDIIYDKLFNNMLKNNIVDFYLSTSPELNPNIDDFINLYKPVKIINEYITYKDVSNYPKSIETNPHTCMSMFINRYRLKKMLNEYITSNNIKYDLVISYRCDLLQLCDINLQELKNNLNSDKDIYIPSGCDYYGIMFPPGYERTGGINDQMAIGSVESINMYLNLYEKIYEMLDSNNVIHPETLLLNYIKSINLNVKRFDTKLEIYR